MVNGGEGNEYRKVLVEIGSVVAEAEVGAEDLIDENVKRLMVAQ